MCVCVCMYVCMFVYIHVCMNGCMCVCVCVCGFSQTFNPTHLREGQDLLIGNCTGISWPIPWTYNVRTYSSLQDGLANSRLRLLNIQVQLPMALMIPHEL